MKLHLEIQPRIPRFVLERNRRLFDPCSAIANRATIKRTETGTVCLKKLCSNVSLASNFRSGI